jgi:ABC-2 type transport system ATP-binding protein
MLFACVGRQKACDIIRICLMAMIELKELTKTYGRYLAVDRLNLSIPKGEIFGFIGPNGAGKTTTIKMMGGILAPTEGSIRIAGIDMAVEPEEAKRKVGFIPDRPFLYEKLTGSEFLRFTADIYGVPESRFDEKAASVLSLFYLSDWSDELIESYSHGMKQRLIMAAALIHDPQVLIVDEPMVGLDPLAIMMVKDLFKRLASQGVTIFMSTHTLQVAQDICDRIGVITRGRLVASGTAADLQREANVTSADLEQVFLSLTGNNG